MKHQGKCVRKYSFILKSASALFSWLLTFPITASDQCMTLTATGGPDYPPASWLKDDALTGYMPALLANIGDKLGLKVTIAPTGNWKRALANAASGNFDIIFGLSKNAERLDLFDYTTPVAYDPVVISTWGESTIKYNGTWQSLIGYQGGVRLGVRFDPNLHSHIENDLTVQKVPNFASAFKLLEHGRLDYFIQSHFALEANAADSGVLDSLNILEPPIVNDEVYMAFSKKSPCRHLVSAFTDVIEQKQASGEIAALVEKYRALRLSINQQKGTPN